jgi:hypothetical protein
VLLAVQMTTRHGFAVNMCHIGLPNNSGELRCVPPGARCLQIGWRLSWQCGGQGCPCAAPRDQRRTPATIISCEPQKWVCQIGGDRMTHPERIPCMSAVPCRTMLCGICIVGEQRRKYERTQCERTDRRLRPSRAGAGPTFPRIYRPCAVLASRIGCIYAGPVCWWPGNCVSGCIFGYRGEAAGLGAETQWMAHGRQE